MGKKLKKLAKRSGDQDLARTVRDSAQQIWLAGLGAWGKTRAEGKKMFSALVREGKGIEVRTRKLAGAQVGTVASQMGKAASEAQARASATWDKLEHVFEQRVARALHRLGVPTSKEIDTLTRRVEALTASIEKLGGTRPARQKARKKAAATRATKRKTKRPAARRVTKRAAAPKGATMPAAARPAALEPAEDFDLPETR